MIKKLPICLILIVFTLMACNKEPTIDVPSNGVFDCEDLAAAMIDEDLESLKAILDPELAKITLLDQDNDACLYTRKLDAIVELLNEACSELDASVQCCSCLESFPTMSQVSVSITNDGVDVEKILNLRDPVELDGSGVMTIASVQ